MLDASPSGSGPSKSNSPDTSFHTAVGSPSNVPASSTAASSPPVRPASPYASSQELPRRLKEHCKIYLEEELYDTGLGLLNNVLFAAAPRRDGARKPMHVPPPSHLALLSTLSLHPVYTSRASDHEHARVPAQALAYLRNLLVVVGPVYANMRVAFQFVDKPRKKNRKLYADDEFSSDGETHQYHEDMLGRPMANESGLWQRGADFWSVLGWALRCSAAYPLRWPHWRRWLEFMVDVLKADWDERVRKDAAEGGPESGRVYAHLEGSIIVGYLTGRDGQCRSLKEVLRALFADGEKPSAVAFREVFYKELKVVDPSKKRKREADPQAEADLEAHRFGDYYFEEEEELSSDTSRPSTPTRRRNRQVADEAAEKPLAPGMVESIPLRLRLLGILSQVAWYLSDFFATPYDLYSSFAVHLNKLPLEAFILFTSCQTSPLVDAAQCMMLKEVMPLLLPSSRRDPIRVDREIDMRGGLTQAMLEKCYLPYAAASTSAAENAKVSLALEGMMYLLVKHDVLEYSEELSSALESGVEAREAKVKAKRKKGAQMTGEEAVALEALKGSGQRLLLVLDVVSEKPPKEKDTEEGDLLVGDAGAG